MSTLRTIFCSTVIAPPTGRSVRSACRTTEASAAGSSSWSASPSSWPEAWVLTTSHRLSAWSGRPAWIRRRGQTRKARTPRIWRACGYSMKLHKRPGKISQPTLPSCLPRLPASLRRCTQLSEAESPKVERTSAYLLRCDTRRLCGSCKPKARRHPKCDIAQLVGCRQCVQTVIKVAGLRHTPSG